MINQKPKAQKPFDETEVSMIKSVRRVYLLRPGSRVKDVRKDTSSGLIPVFTYHYQKFGGTIRVTLLKYTNPFNCIL